MARETLQEKFERETGSKALTKTGTKSKAYSDYLLDPAKCTVPWMANWSKIYKKNQAKAYTKGADLMRDLAEIDKSNRLAEKCARGGIGGTGELLKNIASFRRESLSKYGIKGY